MFPDPVIAAVIAAVTTAVTAAVTNKSECSKCSKNCCGGRENANSLFFFRASRIALVCRQADGSLYPRMILAATDYGLQT
eukprot:764199-Hanusia_phi.AAC.6